jgi:hypothetical protein
MSNYFNFKKTEHSISFEPYLYDSLNGKGPLFIGIAVLITGIVVSVFSIWKDGIYLGMFFSSVLFIVGLYRLLIQNKTVLEFDKLTDSLYKTNPLGKKKKIALSNIYDIITVSEYSSYTYDITFKDKPSAKSIEITACISESMLTNPEIVFLESELLPMLFSFLQLDSRK